MSVPLRQRLGITAAEVPSYIWHLWGGGDWVRLHNRLERLTAAPMRQPGVACEWQWTSDLRACHVYPPLGRVLLCRAIQRWPIGWTRDAEGQAAQPKVSFVIGHRGANKIPHLLATIETILGQADTNVEIVVVEQSSRSVLAHLPARVRHIHTPPPSDDMPYSRSWAFNVGARAARGEILILHDNDLLVPAAYAREAVRALARYDVAYLGRFVFYLHDADSRSAMGQRAAWAPAAPDRVTQNFRGGSLAIRRESFIALGGFDESFVGWGGEDNELFDRCCALRCYSYGYLPFIHLHHPPQQTKLDNRDAVAYLEQRLAMPRAQRAAELAARDFGNCAAPHGERPAEWLSIERVMS